MTEYQSSRAIKRISVACIDGTEHEISVSTGNHDALAALQFWGDSLFSPARGLSIPLTDQLYDRVTTGERFVLVPRTANLNPPTWR